MKAVVFRASDGIFEPGDYIRLDHVGGRRIYLVLSFCNHASTYTAVRITRPHWWTHKVSAWLKRAWQHAKANISDSPWP